MPPRPVPPERTAMLARAAAAIRAVKHGDLDPADALAFAVWPPPAVLAAEATLPAALLASRVKASRASWRPA